MQQWPLGRPDVNPPAPDTVRGWRVLLDEIDRPAELRMRELLTHDERAAADRFHQHADTLRFTAARSALRLLLAAALRCAPHEIELARTPAGKPVLPDGALGFNVSHSGTVVMIAIGADPNVGADVEHVRPVADRADIAARFFHPGEAAELSALSAPEADLAFLRCWTRKEAVAKALGLGLSLPFDAFRVSCRPGDPAALLEVDAAYAGLAALSLFEVAPERGYVGAIAVRQGSAPPHCRTLALEAYA